MENSAIILKHVDFSQLYLNINTITCDVHGYKNDDQILKDLLETNIRQRGDVGGSAKKIGLRIKELERLYEIRDGSANPIGINQYISDGNNSPHQTQEDLAQKLGMDVRTLRNYKLPRTTCYSTRHFSRYA